MGRKRTNNPMNLPDHWHYKNGAFYYRVQAKFKHLFEQQWIRLGTNRPDAHRKFAELPIHQPEDPNSIKTINDLAGLYEREVYPQNGARTVENKRSYMPSILAGVGKMAPGAIRKKHAKQLYRALKPIRGMKTAKECVSLLRHMLTIAEDFGVIDRNHLLNLKLETSPSRQRHVDYDELERFRNATFTNDRGWTLHVCNEFLRNYLALKSITGLDQQTLLSLTIYDIKEEGLRGRRRKTKRLPKTYEWDDEGVLRQVLDDILEFNRKRDVSSIYLFHTRDGDPYLQLVDGEMFDSQGRALGTTSSFRSVWNRAMKKWVALGNEHFTEHDIRKTPASSTTTEHAQDLLDHHNPNTTKRIYQVAERVVKIQTKKKPD